MVAASFALVRFALLQNRAITDRFTTFLERSLHRQEEVNEGFRRALESLADAVHDCVARFDKVEVKR